MKKKTYKGIDKAELKDKLADKSKKLAQFRTEVAIGKTKNVKEGRELRKEVARILTELNAK